MEHWCLKLNILAIIKVSDPELRQASFCESFFFTKYQIYMPGNYWAIGLNNLNTTNTNVSYFPKYGDLSHLLKHLKHYFFYPTAISLPLFSPD